MRPKDEEALQDEQVQKLSQKIGDLGMDIDALRERPSAILRRRGRQSGKAGVPRLSDSADLSGALGQPFECGSQPARRRRRDRIHEELAEKLQMLIQERTTYDYRRLWAILCCGLDAKVNTREDSSHHKHWSGPPAHDGSSTAHEGAEK